jgi:lysozyme
MIYPIPDTSRWQGTIDTNAFMAAIRGWLMKASGGDDGLYTDPQFARCRDAARAANKPRGFYHFAGGGDPKAEAAKFKEAVGDTQPGESIWLDFETGGVSNPVQWSLEFIQEAERLFGQKCHLYTNMGRVWSFDWSPVVQNGSGLWGAIWDFNPTAGVNSQEWDFLALKQYSDQGKLPGVQSTYVDLSAFNGDDIKQFLAYGKDGTTHVDDHPTPVPVPPTPVPPAPQPTPNTYTVVSGDSLSKIASDHGMSLADLEALNHQIADPNVIKPGQLIYLKPANVVVPDNGANGWHIVTPTETLSGIAANYGMSLNALLDLNPQYKANPNLIRIGAQIAVHAQAVNNAPTYTVKQGDTLSSIAAANGTSWQRLRDLNGIANPDVIQPGWTLRLR